MSKMILDFQFDQVTGESRIVIDFHDDSLTALEINESIQSGELRDKAISMAQNVLGPEIARKIREGEIPLICLDHEPDDKDSPATPIPDAADTRKKIAQ